jgi:glycosyltransferase involved in cell wall biosynthesis
MEDSVSVIIPNYNGSATIETCLRAVFSSDYPRYEVIVADDCSTDNSAEIIAKFPCKLVKLDRRSGAAGARNAAALRSSNDILFFTDADCVVAPDTLSRAARSLGGRKAAVIGGTYTGIPCDDTFFSTFQSIFVNYSETKNPVPDYVATHAMVISRELFRKSGGFPEDFLPILEDVEFSHRLRRSGVALAMDPLILVRHIFNFTLARSLRNGFRKSTFWTEYSLANRDALADSGTASRELKLNVVSFFLSVLLVLSSSLSGKVTLLSLLPVIAGLNIFASRGLLRAFHQTKGLPFALAATAYYLLLYPAAVGAGAITGIARFFRTGRRR